MFGKLQVLEKLSLPLIYVLEHTVGCVCGGEDALIQRDSWCCEKNKSKFINTPHKKNKQMKKNVKKKIK